MANTRNIRIGDILKELGYINDEQIAAAAEYQNQHKGMLFGAALIEMKVITEEQMLTALAKGFHYDVVNIADIRVNQKALEMVPAVLAEKYNVLAYDVDDTYLKILVNDPLDYYGMEKIQQVCGCELKISLCTKKEILDSVKYYYAELSAKKAANEAAKKTADVMKVDIEDTDSDEPIINLLQNIIVRAYNSNASDVHIEPYEKDTILRMRIDGTLSEFMEISKSIHSSLLARIKILSDMDIAKKRIPQDGHMKAKVEGKTLNIRVSTIPTIYGEKAVLRMMYSNARIDHENTFGMSDKNYEIMKTCLKAPNGVIYFTGPTGSGKTTTLYMILRELSQKNVNISTIEDPVEQSLEKINQMQVNQVSGLTFEAGLRALLRQDPDIIMVGETRDNETAQISVRASLTGHLVFSTLHTNDSASTIVRLEDMGIADYLIASSLSAVVAQRLVRKVCPECAKEVEMTPAQEKIVGRKIPKIKIACGCNKCNQTGYVGRIAIHEILQVDPHIRQMISDGESATAVKEYACSKLEMTTLEQSAAELLEAGITTMEEYEKIAFYI